SALLFSFGGRHAISLRDSTPDVFFSHLHLFEFGHVHFATIVKHIKGVGVLSVLHARPVREVHVTELEELPADVARAAVTTGRDDAIDQRAIAAYRARLEELEGDLAEAEGANDLARAERIHVERDFLVDELSS